MGLRRTEHCRLSTHRTARQRNRSLPVARGRPRETVVSGAPRIYLHTSSVGDDDCYLPLSSQEAVKLGLVLTHHVSQTGRDREYLKLADQLFKVRPLPDELETLPGIKTGDTINDLIQMLNEIEAITIEQDQTITIATVHEETVSYQFATSRQSDQTTILETHIFSPTESAGRIQTAVALFIRQSRFLMGQKWVNIEYDSHLWKRKALNSAKAYRHTKERYHASPFATGITIRHLRLTAPHLARTTFPCPAKTFSEISQMLHEQANKTKLRFSYQISQ